MTRGAADVEERGDTRQRPTRSVRTCSTKANVADALRHCEMVYEQPRLQRRLKPKIAFSQD